MDLLSFVYIGIIKISGMISYLTTAKFSNLTNMGETNSYTFWFHLLLLNSLVNEWTKWMIWMNLCLSNLGQPKRSSHKLNVPVKLEVSNQITNMSKF